MKLTCVCILFICLAAATFSNWLLIASFNINQAYIAKELCVNRNNPNSRCNGHCYLCKQLNREEKPEGTSGSTSKEKFEVQLFFVDAHAETALLIDPGKDFYTRPQPFSNQLYLMSFFHPPSA
jgi:hypothetical protein